MPPEEDEDLQRRRERRRRARGTEGGEAAGVPAETVPEAATAPAAPSLADEEQVLFHRGLIFLYPKGWSDGSLLTLVEPGPKKHPRSIVVTLHDLERGDTLNRFAGTQLKDVAAKLKVLTISELTYHEFRGRPTAVAMIRWELSTGPVVKQMQAFQTTGRKGFTFTFSALESDFDAARLEVFDRVLETFDYQAPPARP